MLMILAKSIPTQDRGFYLFFIKMIMKKTDIFSYLKILGGLSLTFPLFHAFFALDFGLLKGGFITLCLYAILMLIAIPMYNYLEYGVFWYWVSDKQREKFHKK